MVAQQLSLVLLEIDLKRIGHTTFSGNTGTCFVIG